MKNVLSALGVSVLLLVPTALPAQDHSALEPEEQELLNKVTKCLNVDEVPDKAKDECRERYDPKVGVTDLKGAALENSSGVVVSVNEKTETASIRFTKPRLQHKFSATVSASVDKETGAAEFVGFGDNLGVDNLQLEYNYIKWPTFPLFTLAGSLPPGDDGYDVLVPERRFVLTTCVVLAKGLKNLPERDWPELPDARRDELLKQLEKHPEDKLPTWEAIDSYTQKLSKGIRFDLEGEGEEKIGALMKDYDYGEGLCKEIIKSLSDEKLLEFYRTVGLSPKDLETRVLVLGANSSVGRKEFTFLDRDLLFSDGTVESTSDRELPLSVGVRFGWLFLERTVRAQPQASLIFSYNRQRSYEAADNLTVCQPAENFEDFESVESCLEIAAARPSEDDSDLLSVEYRRKYAKFGLAVRGFYRGNDGKDDDFGLEIPIYFLVNKDAGLQGGLTVGWRDQDDDGSVAVFVGKKFEL